MTAPEPRDVEAESQAMFDGVMAALRKVLDHFDPDNVPGVMQQLVDRGYAIVPIDAVHELMANGAKADALIEALSARIDELEQELDEEDES